MPISLLFLVAIPIAMILNECSVHMAASIRKFSELFFVSGLVFILLLNHPFSASSSEEKGERQLTNKNRNILMELSFCMLSERNLNKEERTNTF